MRFRSKRARCGGLAAVLLPALAVAGCGTTTIDNSKAEQLIRNSVNSAGQAKVKSVSCPSGVTAKAGATYTCQISVTTLDGATHSGTVTLHMTNNSGHVVASASDFHLQ